MEFVLEDTTPDDRRYLLETNEQSYRGVSSGDWEGRWELCETVYVSRSDTPNCIDWLGALNATDGTITLRWLALPKSEFSWFKRADAHLICNETSAFEMSEDALVITLTPIDWRRVKVESRVHPDFIGFEASLIKMLKTALNPNNMEVTVYMNVHKLAERLAGVIPTDLIPQFRKSCGEFHPENYLLNVLPPTMRAGEDGQTILNFSAEDVSLFGLLDGAIVI